MSATSGLRRKPSGPPSGPRGADALHPRLPVADRIGRRGVRGGGQAEGRPVSATFTGLVQLTDIVEGRSLRIGGEGKGGVAGFAKGGATVTFEPIPEGTRLTYDAEASVGGKIAQLGSRIIDSFARKLADEFFARFQAAVEPPDPAEEEAAAALREAVEAGATGPAEAGTEKKGWFRKLIG